VTPFGSYPTRVEHLEGLSTARSSLWVKRDDETSALYGGNKVRKLERLLFDAVAQGKKRVITVGAAGSHHVLATGVFGRKLGLEVEAALVPQVGTPHVLENLRADVGQGIRLWPTGSFAQAAAQLVARRLAGAYYIPVGGSNRLGAEAFADAASELALQVRAGLLPEPDLVVVALGSGGTAAGLAAGFARERMRTRVCAVTVAEPVWAVERRVRGLARRCALGLEADALARLSCERRYLGPGYGRATPESAQATAAAATSGIVLDATYTAKTFAAALDRVRDGQDRTVLYWHTLSSAPLAPLLTDAPAEDALDPRLLRLVLPAPAGTLEKTSP
jgi:1-aminocyclopropane-1-carboxylate deaminase/D-cysteine desulfhydrase-like pyridoxal-dependent ACC family enzyme